MDELRAAFRELAAAPSAEQADVLVVQLSDTPPSPELAELLSETLELPALHEVRDSRGVPLRWRLVDRLLALGFPHALHVTPDDLDYHRGRSLGRARIPAALTAGAGFVSMLWALLCGTFAIGLDSALPGALAAAAFAHGLLALISAARPSAGREAPLLKPLALAVVAAPVIAGGVQALTPIPAIVVLLFAIPTMATAVLCSVTASVNRSVTPELPVLPEPSEAEIRPAVPARVTTR